MARIMAVDYGAKRCGLAITDPMKIIASGLNTIPPQELISFIKNYHQKEPLEAIVFGIPYRMDGSLSPIASEIKKAMDSINQALPGIELHGIDESFTSAEAMQAMVQAGVPKKKRRNKELTDKVSATLILQRFLHQQQI
ncbi:MAG: Holliday junction resolvase RuvX [Bacteroidetes bacterium]|nr:Holliday junction resolvase RuvX [Bacteroidota bacterium]